MRISFWAVLLIFFQAHALLAGLDEIREKGVLRHLGVSYARFSIGSCDGLCADLVKGFAASLNVDYEYVPSTWTTVIQDLTGKTYALEKGKATLTGQCPVKGDIIASGMTILPWRRELIDYSIPTFPSGVWLVARADSRLSPIQPGNGIKTDIEAVKSLIKGITVLAMPGTCLDPELYGFHTTGANFVSLNLKMCEFVPAVINGEAECSLLDVPVALLSLEKWPGQLKVIGPVSPPQKMGCGFRKSDAGLRETFNQYLKTLQENGRYMELIQTYYPGAAGYFPDFFQPNEPR